MSFDDMPVSRRTFLGISSAAVAGVGVSAMPAGAAQRTGDLQGRVNKRENVDVEMRDGRILQTDVYLPPQADRGEATVPTLLARTPYSKAGYEGTAQFFTDQDYAVVVQDVRGKFESAGDFYPYRSEGQAEAEDGYDTVEWAGTQDWSNGSVGTFGISYLAGTQWALVHNDELPPHLEAMAPGYAVSSYYGQGAYAGGAALLSHNVDYLTGFAVERYDRENPDVADEFTSIDAAQESIMQQYWDLPVQPFEPLQEIGYDWLSDWHTNETYDDYWRQQDHSRHYDKVDVPVLNYGGWYDIFTQGTVQNYQGLAAEAGTDEAQSATELVVGPYTHGDQGIRAQGQVTGHAYRFPENAVYDELQMTLRFFDRHLKEGQGTAGSVPSVRLYVPGLDEWVGADEFPLPETTFANFYLHSDGNANASAIDDENPAYSGRLSTTEPDDEPADEYTYDPGDPVVTVGGYNTHWNGGVADRATAYHDRDDVLVYETPVLSEDVAVVGPITATLHASTSTRDTDFVVHLSDVDPTARTGGLWVAEGARRGRIGDVEADPRGMQTYAETQLLEPGEVNAWQIAVWPTARVFEAGHRIRVDVTSSDFPRYSRNLNTGEGLDGSEMTTADQTVYHDAERPSHVEFPVVPVSALEDRVVDSPGTDGDDD